MMEIIDAVSAMDEPEFSSPEDAIKFSQSLQSARRNDVDSCIGHVVASAEWCANALRLNLDNGKAIVFRCTGKAVNVALEDAALGNIGLNLQKHDVALLRIGGRESMWKRRALGFGLHGNKVRAIRPGRSIYFLGVENNDVLLIGVLINRSTASPFLFWYPET